MSTLYTLGDYEVDSLRRQLRLNGKLVPLAQKPFDVLLFLINRAGQVVTKEELMRAIWPQSFVEESNLTQSIFLLRKALQDQASGGRFIITVPGRGYQLGIIPTPIVEAAALPEPLPETEADMEVQPDPIGSHPAGRDGAATRASYRRVSLLALCGLVLTLFSYAGWKLWNHRTGSSPAYTLRRLTNSGDVQVIAMSPSGSYVAFVSKGALGSESLWVTDLRSGTSRVILHDDLAVLRDITFSPGDLYLYYRSSPKSAGTRVSSEQRVPLLGGEPIVVIRDIDGPATFSDDGKRLCFWRGTGEKSFSILSVDAESGRDERLLASGRPPLPIDAVCAPDGQKAAISTEVGGISIIDFKTGERRPFYRSTKGDEFYTDLAWKADSSELLGVALTPFDLTSSLFSISYPYGVRKQITHDIVSYRDPSIASDGNTIVARQGMLNAQFQSFDLPLHPDNPEVNSFPWTEFLGWSDDDKIIGSAPDGAIKRKDIAADQEHSIQMLKGMHFLQPNGCGARSIVASGSDGTHNEISIWRMNVDGSVPVQLTHGPEDILPACSPDGKWVLYADNSFLHEASIYRVSIHGGEPKKVGEGSVWFAVSHRGDKVAWIENEGQSMTLVQAELESGRRIGSISISPQLHASRPISFSSDDQQVFLISASDTADSIYEMPLDGSVPVKHIEFRGARVAAVAVSPGGKHLGVVTVKPVSDAVLLRQSDR